MGRELGQKLELGCGGNLKCLFAIQVLSDTVSCLVPVVNLAGSILIQGWESLLLQLFRQCGH